MRSFLTVLLPLLAACGSHAQQPASSSDLASAASGPNLYTALVGVPDDGCVVVAAQLVDKTLSLHFDNLGGCSAPSDTGTRVYDVINVEAGGCSNRVYRGQLPQATAGYARTFVLVDGRDGVCPGSAHKIELTETLWKARDDGNWTEVPAGARTWKTLNGVEVH